MTSNRLLFSFPSRMIDSDMKPSFTLSYIQAAAAVAGGLHIVMATSWIISKWKWVRRNKPWMCVVCMLHIRRVGNVRLPPQNTQQPHTHSHTHTRGVQQNTDSKWQTSYGFCGEWRMIPLYLNMRHANCTTINASMAGVANFWPKIVPFLFYLQFTDHYNTQMGDCGTHICTTYRNRA